MLPKYVGPKLRLQHMWFQRGSYSTLLVNPSKQKKSILCANAFYISIQNFKTLGSKIKNFEIFAEDPLSIKHVEKSPAKLEVFIFNHYALKGKEVKLY